ncbi:MAG: hypothetical protein ACREIP_08460, partial [Alphaproteobacteria bacterium]
MMRFRVSFSFISFLLSAIFATGLARAQGDEGGFRSWIESFKAEARAQGIGAAILESAFAAVKYNARVIELDS